LTALVIASLTTFVGGGRDGVRQRAVVDVHVEGERNSSHQARQRRRQAVVQADRPEPVCDLSELGDGSPDLGDALVEEPVEVHGAVVEMALGEPQRHAEGDQALLGAVVQVALEATALVVPGR
jgi:hypothetical protein